MLEVQKLCKKFNQTTVLNSVSLTINEGDFVIISGESGCGKTTFLKLVTGLAECDQGIVKYQNKEVTFKELQTIRKEDFSIVFQEKNLIPEYNVYQNLQIVADNESIQTILQQFHMEEFKYRKIDQLSGGQLQRVAIIRALLKKPKILFLDEPTGNLDENTTFEIMNLLKEVNKNTTIVMITHDHSLFDYGNKIVNIEYGQLSVEQKHAPRMISSYSYHKNYPLFKMAIWNFKYYLKTYLLGILIFTLISTGFVFSKNIGETLDEDLKKEMIARDSEYELIIESEDIVSIEDVKDYSLQTKAKDYDLNLKLFLSQDSYKFYLDGEETEINKGIRIASNYELKSPTEQIGLSLGLVETLHLDKFKDIKMELSLLNSFNIYKSIYWVDDTFKLYEPNYQKEIITLEDYQIIDTDEMIIYFSNDLIEQFARASHTGDLTFSNQQIKRFKLKYDSYETLSEAKIYFDNNTSYKTYSIYDDFKGIEHEAKTQFAIFNYSSYIMLGISILVVGFILSMIDNYKREQKRVLHELGLRRIESILLILMEIGFFLVSIILLSWISSSLFISIFNASYGIETFLPTSFIQLAKMYHLPLERISWFNVNIITLFIQIAFMCIIMTLISFVFILYKNRKYTLKRS